MNVFKHTVLAVTAGLSATAVLAACAGGVTSAGAQSRPASSGSVQWMPTPKLPTVKQVAAQIGATGATGNCGGGAAVGVTESGTANLGGMRLGINVFPTNALRDQWETGIAASVGVIVIAQGQDWVAYKALSQTGTGCN